MQLPRYLELKGSSWSWELPKNKGSATLVDMDADKL